MIEHLTSFIPLAIILPVIAGIIRVREIAEDYYYFFAYLFLGFLTDYSASFIFTLDESKKFVYLLYSIISVFLLLAIIYQWSGLRRNGAKFWVFIVILLMGVFIDILNPNNNNFHLIGTKINLIILVFLLIELLGKLISRAAPPLYKNSKVIIVFCTILYLLIFVTVTVYIDLLYKRERQYFFLKLYLVHQLVTLLMYIFYTLAILWAPKKEKFMSHF